MPRAARAVGAREAAATAAGSAAEATEAAAAATAVARAGAGGMKRATGMHKHIPHLYSSRLRNFRVCRTPHLN